ncbi:methyl-accepting chemotaxis protein [Denitromonas iodatirespirans]|uniref:Methyl-accepting chemotaxis protein n=1 Tax=Denitromonas iodatirespirans TaxID=2795389 RepID=A0A944HA31_DENI1|nr:PAS domain-containing methyl-accepting chemotaxis protein [Denitromonas iodatirespirans]MBT0964103.1 methyl-accepting chemotaxis protein [Denitromonas iodatirespirans]
MKNNQPVTNQEHFLKPGRPIVTKTDLKGIVTYANAAFVEISGFAPDELIGHNHNVVRHPDMPVEAFADLWATIKAGHTWRGLVKNRSNDGGFYWVDAFVTPLSEAGRPVGFISVRSAPERSAIDGAEKLYRAVREKQASFPATRPPAKLTTTIGQIRLSALGAAVLAATAGLLDGPWAVGAGMLAAAAALAAACVFEFRVAKPLQCMVEKIRALDQGRLNEQISSAEGGGLAAVFGELEAMRIHLGAMFADVLVATRSVHERADALQGAMQSLRRASEQQGQKVMEAAAAMEEMSVSVNEISNNTDVSAQAARETESAVSEAARAIQAGIDSSDRVVSVVSAARDQVIHVNESVQKIGAISLIIQEIAEQTNLLALNAAIEAARAGEQGRGFAVVADEVRKLAERTRASTVEIGQSLSEIGSQSQAAVATIETASSDVAAGSRLVGASASSLDCIRDASHRASEVAGEIRLMLEQQATASHEVATAMEAISAGVDGNNAAIAEIDTAAKHLNATAGELRALTRHLEGMVK